MFCTSRLFCAADTPAHRTATPRDVPGSRVLATYRAARLQKRLPSRRSVRSTRSVFATLLGSFLILQALWRFRVTPRRPRPREWLSCGIVPESYVKRPLGIAPCRRGVAAGHTWPNIPNPGLKPWAMIYKRFAVNPRRPESCTQPETYNL